MSLRKHMIKLAMRLENTWRPVDLSADAVNIEAGWYVTEFTVQGAIKHIPEIVVEDVRERQVRRSLIGFHSGRNRMLIYLPKGRIIAYDKTLQFDFLSRVSALEGRARVLLICARYLADFFSFKLLFRIIGMQFQNRFELSTDLLQFYYPKNYLYEIQRWNRLKGFERVLRWWCRGVTVAVVLEDESQLKSLSEQLVQADHVLLAGRHQRVPNDVDYLIPLANTERLREPAIAMIKRAIIKREIKPSLIYTDHDYSRVKGDSAQGAMEPALKPEPSLAYLHCYHYIDPTLILRTDQLPDRSIDGLFDNNQRYRVALECFKDVSQVLHINEALFISDREGGIKTPDPVSQQSAWPNIQWLRQGDYNVLRASPHWHERPSVDLIIPTRDGLDVLKPCIESVLNKTEYPNYQIIVVDNGSEQAETKAYLSRISKYERIQVIDFPGEFNYSAINNTAASQGDSDYIALINNDIEVIDADWLTQMMVWATQANVGIVGAKLLYSNGNIQHAGVTVGMGNAAGHIHRLEDGKSLGYQNRLVAVQNMMAVTAACLITRRSLFEELGGLDEQTFKVAYNDIDYCLRVEQMGMDIIWTPEARLFHHESVTRGDDMSEKHIERYFSELASLQKRWKTKGFVDKYYSKHLRISDEGVYPQEFLVDIGKMHHLGSRNGVE